jgi:hypothetical protein
MSVFASLTDTFIPQFDIDNRGHSGAPARCRECGDVWARYSFVVVRGQMFNSLDCEECMVPVAVEEGGAWRRL